MKPAEAPTLSQHLLHEAARFFVYPHKVYRSRLNLATQRLLEDGIRRLIDWRRTFAPPRDVSTDDFFTSEVMLDQMYCRIVLQEVPEMVKRTRALRSLTLSGISNAEYFVYIREAAQCYVSGLPQAAVALSRAAVENRIKEVCAKRFGRSAVENSELKELIDNVAPRAQVLSKEGRELAHIVRRAGNEVLHDEPTVSNALQVIESARQVIMLLHGK